MGGMTSLWSLFEHVTTNDREEEKLKSDVNYHSIKSNNDDTDN